MNINTEKIPNNTLDVIDIVTKYYFDYNSNVVEKAKHMTKCCAKAKDKWVDAPAKIDDLRTKLNDICEALEEAVDIMEENVVWDEDHIQHICKLAVNMDM
jgi:hypothetical protein